MSYNSRSTATPTGTALRLSYTDQKPLLGIGCKVSSITLFVVMMVTIKLMHPDVPIGQIVFIRAIIGLATIHLLYQLRDKLTGKSQSSTMAIRSPTAHLPWALSAALAMGMWFTAITLIPLPEATAIGFVMPLLVVAFAWLILGEQIRLIRSVAIVLGLVGVAIIIWPRLGLGADRSSAAAIGAMLSLSASVAWAWAQIKLRVLSRTETSGSAVVSFSVATMILSLLTLPLGWVIPDYTEWVWLLICGIAGGLGQLAAAEALRFTAPSTLAPFEYLSFPIASIAAITLFSEHPDANIWWGLPFVVAGGLLVIVREYQLGKRQP